MRFCSFCNIEIEEQFNFCPNCGASLEEKKESESFEAFKVEQLICNSCGEENEVGSSFCVSCGANLKGGKTEIREVKKAISEPVPKITEQKRENQNQKFSQKKQQSKNLKFKKENVVTRVEKKKNSEFGTKKIAIVFSIILLFTIVVLYFSGVFDEPIISSENFQPVNQPQASGIDLASIDKINQLDAQLKSEPSNYDLMLQLAHLKNDSGFKEDAIKLYKKYLEKFPANTDVLVDMGVCYFDLKNYDEAIPAMEKAIKINPQHQIANMNLGIVNLAKGNIEKSKEWLQKAVNLDPNSEIGRKAKELLTSH